MAMERNARINRIFLAKGTANISLVDFQWIFSESTLPGVETTHAGIIDISGAGLQQGASPDAVMDAIDAVMAPVMEQILNFHAEQLGFEYAVANSDAVNVSEPTSDAVDAERDRRIVAGFTFDGTFYQTRPEDRENIAGAKSAASDAIALGAQPGNYAWRKLLDPKGPDVFAWIAADNHTVPMDAQTVRAFAYAAMAHKEEHIFAARQIKNMPQIPADFATNPAYWPIGG